jgi:hypothetical protein
MKGIAMVPNSRGFSMLFIRTDALSAQSGLSPKRGWSGLLLSGVAFAALFASSSAQAAGVISFGNDQSISVGLGLRTSYSDVEHGAPNGGDASAFSVDDLRLYVSGQFNSWLKATFNTERDANGNVDILDAYAQFEPMDEFNVWIGRMLPPSDRANLDGPFYLSTWLYPGVVSQYPAKFAGRDDGATIWGKLFDKKLVYSVGVFNGHNRVLGASNQGDNMLYAGRIAYNFLDPEPDPAYYTSSTYYGTANILTVAFATQYQSDGVGTAVKPGNYFGWNFDALFEKNFADIGTVTLEGAYYKYETGSVLDVSPSFGGSGPTANVGGINQGKAFLLSADYMFPQKFGPGSVQPAFRYQEFDPNLTTVITRQYDAGVNYILDGQNARVSADYVNAVSGHLTQNEFILGLQLQI